MKVSGGEYAKVNERMLEFRNANPRGKISTTPEYITINQVPYIQFRAEIVKDKSDETSAEASGHARLQDDNKQKTFEKCETIAVGRALAFLGYGANGEIASSEEMEEFQAHKQAQYQEAVNEATERIGNCETVEQLKEVWSSLSGEMKVAVKPAQEAKKLQLNENN